MPMNIAIIGGGACGLVAAYQLKKSDSSLNVTVFEKNPTVGKKILMSGNSHGNLSNTHVAPSAYNHPDFVAPALAFDSTSLRSFAAELGVETFVDEEGRIYPLSNSANSFLDALRLASHELGVKEITSYEVFSINQGKSGQWTLNGTDTFDKVILATGSSAGYYLKRSSINLPKMGPGIQHSLTPLYPSLAPIGVQENIRSLTGLRIACGASIDIDGNRLFQTTGEIQFKEDALSGIAIFELSSFLARKLASGNVSVANVELDLYPSLTEEEVLEQLTKRHAQFPNREGVAFFVGMFPKMIGWYLATRLELNHIRPETLKEVAHLFKHLRFAVDLTYVATNNQVVCGGVRIDQINPETLESRLAPGMYFGGEVLDIDGLCGGYNLHFAFASGVLIANSILKGLAS